LEARACIATLQFLLHEAVATLAGASPPEVDHAAAPAAAPAVSDAQACVRHAAAIAAVGKHAERLLSVLGGATHSQEQALAQAVAAVGAEAAVGAPGAVATSTSTSTSTWTSTSTSVGGSELEAAASAQRGACKRVREALAAAEATVRAACEAESGHEDALRGLEAARKRLQAAKDKADAAPLSEDLVEADDAEFNEVAAAASALKQAREAVAQAAAALEARGIPPGVAVAKARATEAAARAAVAGEAVRQAEVSDALQMEQRFAKLRALHTRLMVAWRAADDATGGRAHEAVVADAADAERDAACEALRRTPHESALARLAHIQRRRAALDEEEAVVVREYLRAADNQDLLARAEALRREAARALS